MKKIGFRVNCSPAHSFPAHHFKQALLVQRRGIALPDFKRLPPQTGQELGFCAPPAGPGLPERVLNLSAAQNTAWQPLLSPSTGVHKTLIYNI